MFLLGLKKKQLCFCSLHGFISVHSSMSFPFLIKAPILWDTDSTIMTSFQSSYLKCNHSGNHDGTEMEWCKIGPITLFDNVSYIVDFLFCVSFAFFWKLLRSCYSCKKLAQ